MHLAGLWLTDFRCYEELHLEFPPGVSVISGANAQGKTSLLEAVSWVATRRSFRGVNDAALVRSGRPAAIVRGEIRDDDRTRMVEAEIQAVGRNRVLIDGKALTKRRDLADVIDVTVFAPDDLDLVKGGPAGRREFLDDLLVGVAPRYGGTRADYDRVLRQRNALLRGGLRGPDGRSTLAVFDLQLATAAADLVRGRLRLLERLMPYLGEAHDELTGGAAKVEAVYEAEWADQDALMAGDLAAVLVGALEARHRAEVERGVTLAGPHRDDLRIQVNDLDSRTRSSQGEQRTLALALRLGGHRLTTEVKRRPPVLLLDDVFSELDDHRASALVEHLGVGQTLITTAGVLPSAVTPELLLHVHEGRVEPAA